MKRLAIALLFVATPAVAQQRPPTPKPPAKCAKLPCVNEIDMTRGLDLRGSNHTLHLVFFLERADEELQRASLEKKSFIPAMTKSVDEDL